MSDTVPPRLVFISHSAADEKYARDFEVILEGQSIAAWNFKTQVREGDDYLTKAHPALKKSTHIVVLVGDNTKDSQWVDMEMEIAMASSVEGPGAILIGVILPDHPDFSRPYYEPTLVPVRLDDFVKRGGALLKKWSTDPAEISKWLSEADEKRKIMPRSPRPSFATLRSIREKHWNKDEAVPGGLPSLSAQHVQQP